MSAVATIRSQLSTSSHAPPQTSPPTSAMVAIGSRRKYSKPLQRVRPCMFGHLGRNFADVVAAGPGPLHRLRAQDHHSHAVDDRFGEQSSGLFQHGVVSRLRLSGSQNVIRITAPSVRHVHSLTITESRGRRGQATQAEQQAALHIKNWPFVPKWKRGLTTAGDSFGDAASTGCAARLTGPLLSMAGDCCCSTQSGPKSKAQSAIQPQGGQSCGLPLDAGERCDQLSTADRSRSTLHQRGFIW